jgi:hypothetical protein
MKISNFKLALGFPLSFPFVPSDFFFGCMMMERPEFVVLRAENGPIDALRNNLVEAAQRNRCSHLMMMDCDMVYHPKTITKLLSHKLPIVGALCYRRYPPFDPLLLKGDPVKGYESMDAWDEGALVEVDATGTGCLMFDMRIFNKMPAPWFRFRQNPNETVGGIIGEDIGFCWDLKRAGYQIFVDTTVPSKHLTTLAVNDATYRLYKAMKTKQTETAIAKALSGKNQDKEALP